MNILYEENVSKLPGFGKYFLSKKFEIKSFYLRNSVEGVDLILVENYNKREKG